MLNTQAPSKLDRDDDGYLKLHSIFNTIQGEGPFTGYAAIFIRLFGCNLQCPFCDTDYTSNRNEVSPQSILSSLENEGWDPGNLVVITGGEPFRQNINPLVWMLIEHGFLVQIESNGVLYPGDDFPWDEERVTVVVSPKTGKIHPETAKRASAFKYVLSVDSVGVDGLPETALGHPLGGYPHVARPPEGWEGPIYLNPMDTQDEVANDRNLQAVASSIMENRNYIMGVQLHKLLGLP